MTRSGKLGALSLAVAGVLFLLYPAVRPWHDESTVDGAVASMGSGAWVAAHAFAMVGFVLVPLGLLALRDLAAGRLVLALGGVLAALAVRRSGTLPRHSGLLLGLGLLLFLPQFFMPAPVRVAHGALLAAGCAWLASTLWRARPPR